MNALLVMDIVIITVQTLLVHITAPAILDINCNLISTVVKVMNYATDFVC